MPRRSGELVSTDFNLGEVTTAKCCAYCAKVRQGPACGVPSSPRVEVTTTVAHLANVSNVLFATVHPRIARPHALATSQAVLAVQREREALCPVAQQLQHFHREATVLHTTLCSRLAQYEGLVRYLDEPGVPRMELVRRGSCF